MMASGHLKCTAVVSRREYKMSISVHAILTLTSSVRKAAFIGSYMVDGVSNSERKRQFKCANINDSV